MAWEELLRLHDGREADPSQKAGREQTAGGGLLQMVRRAVGEPEQPLLPEAPEEEGDAGLAACRDGYVRRSPVQVYRTAADFKKRRVRKIITAVVVLIFAVLLAIALTRAGLFRLRT